MVCFLFSEVSIYFWEWHLYYVQLLQPTFIIVIKKPECDKLYVDTTDSALGSAVFSLANPASLESKCLGHKEKHESTFQKILSFLKCPVPEKLKVKCAYFLRNFVKLF